MGTGQLLRNSICFKLFMQPLCLFSIGLDVPVANECSEFLSIIHQQGTTSTLLILCDAFDRRILALIRRSCRSWICQWTRRLWRSRRVTLGRVAGLDARRLAVEVLGRIPPPARAPDHGYSNTKIYGVWRQMRARCRDPNHPRFAGCAIQIEFFPFKCPTTSATEYFGGIECPGAA
jgi:hypothetical protein